MNSFFTYTLARFGLLAATLVVGYIAGLRGLWLYVGAFIGSGALSLVLLDRQRNAMGNKVTGYFEKLNDKIDESARKEDID